MVSEQKNNHQPRFKGKLKEATNGCALGGFGFY
jgi:hypothetical protein